MTLVWIIAAQLVFLPWALGGSRDWAQIASFVLSIAALITALWPREYTDVAPGQAPFRLYTWTKLLRFPIFWLGLALLGYMVVQTLNPAWSYETNGKSWWMKQIAHTSWLPTGVKAPFELYGPWRLIMIFSSAFLSACAAWIGFTRRRSLQLLFTAVTANAFALAILGIAERATDATKIFWFWTPPASYFVSSFIYKNHAAAYFNLVLALCAGLALWHFERSSRRLDKSSPSGLFAFFATALVLLVIFSYSRTGTLLMFAFLVIAVAIFFWRRQRQKEEGARGPLIAILVVLALGSFIYLGMRSLRTERFLASFAALKHQVEEAGLGAREKAAKATWEMAQDKLGYGWGVGSYRFCFTIYQQRDPLLLRLPDSGRAIYWDHAHNDYLEMTAELGLVGVGLILLMAGTLAFKYIRAHAWQNPIGLFGALGCGLVATHSVVDFNTYNTAILTTWCVLLISIIRWAEIEEISPQG